MVWQTVNVGLLAYWITKSPFDFHRVNEKISKFLILHFLIQPICVF